MFLEIGSVWEVWRFGNEGLTEASRRRAREGRIRDDLLTESSSPITPSQWALGYTSCDTRDGTSKSDYRRTKRPGYSTVLQWFCGLRVVRHKSTMSFPGAHGWPITPRRQALHSARTHLQHLDQYTSSLLSCFCTS